MSDRINNSGGQIRGGPLYTRKCQLIPLILWLCGICIVSKTKGQRFDLKTQDAVHIHGL
jgi:hypothetical protein